MTKYAPAYRLTVYAPLSVDPTEATILTPADTSIHADAFKIASISGVTGFQPYLNEGPRGRRGRIDPMKAKLDVGTFTFDLIDRQLVSGSNLRRWLTAFFGNANGKPRGRLKVYVEESLDGGATWSAFFTGELVKYSTKKNLGTLTVADRVERMKMPVFVGVPHSSIAYTSRATLLPVGFVGASYGVLQSTSPLTGAIADLDPTYAPSDVKVVSLDTASRANLRNILTQDLLNNVGVQDLNAYPDPDRKPLVSSFGSPAICHIKRLDTSAEGDFLVGGLTAWEIRRNGRLHLQVVSALIRELDTAAGGYMAMPPTTTLVEISIRVDAPTSKDNPLLIYDIDPATFITDICAGKFSALFHYPETLPAGKAYGDVKRTIAIGNVASFVGTRAEGRWYITDTEPAIDVIERICLENHWGLWLDALGQLNLIDLDLPSSLSGLSIITDDDCVADGDAEWDHDPTKAISRVNATFYEDVVQQPNDLWDSADVYPPFGSVAVQPRDNKLVLLYAESLDYGDTEFNLELASYRAVDGDIFQSVTRGIFLEQRVRELAEQYRRPWECGPATFPLTARRTSTINALKQGDLVLASISWIPDPYTHLRGGTRCCRVLEKSEDGLAVQLQLLDVGVNVIAAVPSLAQPNPTAGDAYSGLSVAVTLNADSQPVHVQVAATAAGTGSAPAASSKLWHGGYIVTSSSTLKIRNLPHGKRIWVRGRTQPKPSAKIHLPSDWVAAGGTGYADLTAIPVPSAVTLVSKTAKSIVVSWTNGATLPIEVLIAEGAVTPTSVVHKLPAGTVKCAIYEINPSTLYRIGIRHVWNNHPSTMATLDVTSNASPSTACPDLKSFTVYA